MKTALKYLGMAACAVMLAGIWFLLFMTWALLEPVPAHSHDTAAAPVYAPEPPRKP